MSDAGTREVNVRPPKRRIMLPVLLALALFLSGAVVGGGATIIAIRSAALAGLHNPEKAPEWISKRLSRLLSLSKEQDEVVLGILRSHFAKLEMMRAENRPRVQTELDAIRKEVADVLTPEQTRKWEAGFDRLRSLWMPAAPSSGANGEQK